MWTDACHINIRFQSNTSCIFPCLSPCSTFGAPKTVLNTSSRVSGMSNTERFFASLKEISRMIWVSAEVDKASGNKSGQNNLVKPLARRCRILPVSQSSLPSLPGVPTAAAIFVLFRYATCSSSLKCLAKSFAISPPFSPCNFLSLRTLVTSATRKAAPAMKIKVGHPFDFGLCDNRVRSVGRTGTRNMCPRHQHFWGTKKSETGSRRLTLGDEIH